jgi:hypothetical protein
MAKRPKNRKVDRSMLDQGGVTPLRALTVALPRPKNTNYSRFKDGGQVKGSKFKGTF